LGKCDLTSLFCLTLVVMLLGTLLVPVSSSAQAMQFTQVSTFSPPNGTAYVLSGDLNGDGKPDLIVISNEGSGVPSLAYVLLGNGDGSFGPPTGYPIGTYGNSQPNQTVLADLRGNGNLDLIVSTIGVNVLLGNGDGTFQPSVSYSPSTESANGLTIGDFNGDKKLDLGISAYSTIHNGFSGEVEVFPGNGDGTFGTAITTSLGNVFAGSMASGDFNGDGKLDIAVNTAAGLQILLGNGDGTFQSGAIYSLGDQSGGPVVADLNSDGTLDLAEANGTDGSSTQVDVLLGNGDGTFKSPISFAPGAEDSSLVDADMNGDGKIDLVVGDYTGFSVWLGNGDGTFSSGAAVTVTGAKGVSVAVGSFKTGALPGVAARTYNNAFVFLQGVSPVVSLGATSLTFSPQAPGTTSSSHSITLTNSGTATLTVSGIGISGANSSSFAQTSNCTSLAANGSCQINVTYTPIAAGAQTASLTVTDNAPGSTQTVALNGTGSDFSLSVTTQPSITVTPGQAANYSVSVNPTVGFSQTVALTCSGAPAQSTCAVTPASVTLNSSTSGSVNVAVVTSGATAGMTQPSGGPSTKHPLGIWAVFSGTLGLALLMSTVRCPRDMRPHLRYGLAFLCLLSFGMGMSACGGGSSGNPGGGGGTPAGTYALTVTGTYTAGSTTLTHNTKLTLVVQ
jgi:hypothetical protein